MNNLLILDELSIYFKKRVSFFAYTKIVILSKISLSIVKGETLGIVGRNGCGKSTLLRVLAGIYLPDDGVIHKKAGITASLLTLGAGFDPNLSGRDNALLSSMLMGFSKKETLSIMPDIIEFSELGDYIDQPIKSYSTGMRARLGFSIGIQIVPDVLLIDEVLGVGDIHFRQKAEAAMKEKINSEQTVVLVSHDLGTLHNVSDRVLWIDQGKLIMIDTPDKVISQYKKNMLHS